MTLTLLGLTLDVHVIANAKRNQELLPSRFATLEGKVREKVDISFIIFKVERTQS